MSRASNVGLLILIGAVALAALAAGSWWAYTSLRGGGADRRPAPSPASETPAARLDHARAAWDADDRAGAMKWLETLMDDLGESGRVAATWLVTLHLQDHDVEGAKIALDRVWKAFHGRGVDPRGQDVDADLMADALADEAAAAARSRVEGPAPDLAGAHRALDLAESGTASAATEGEDVVQAARRYVALSDPPDAIVDPPEPSHPRVVDLRDGLEDLPAVKGPRVVVFADDFQLGEPILPSVLKRWSKGIPVAVVGRLTGHVRQGIRRVRVDSSMEEKDSIARRLKDSGVAMGGFVRPECVVEARLGLLTSVGAYVFVLDADGHLVARMSGNALDPRPLDPVVARLVPDPSVIAPPR